MSSEGGKWPLEPLGRLCRVSSGTTPSRAAGSRYFTHQGVPWVKTLDLNEGPLEATDESLTEVAIAETGVHVYPVQSVLLAMYGGWEQIGRTAILAVPAAVNQAISVLEAGPQIEARYLLLALQHGRPRWSRYAASTRKDPNITKSDVLEFGVPVPPLPAQRRIVEVIDSIREMGRAIETSIAKLRSVRQGLMASLLFPVAGVRGAWAVRSLEAVAEVSGGLALGGISATGGSVELPYLRVANVQDGFISTAEMKTVRVTPVDAQRFRLRRGDVLVTEGGDFDKVGRGAVWDARIEPCLHQNHVFRVRCREGVITPEFLAIYMASQAGRAYFLSVAKQTTNLASISSSQLKAMPVPCPPLADQKRVVEVLAVCDKQIRLETNELGKLRKLKQGLMDNLLSGRVVVSAAAA